VRPLNFTVRRHGSAPEAAALGSMLSRPICDHPCSVTPIEASSGHTSMPYLLGATHAYGGASFRNQGTGTASPVENPRILAQRHAEVGDDVAVQWEELHSCFSVPVSGAIVAEAQRGMRRCRDSHGFHLWCYT
jgi:hypothetical protein